MENKEYLEKIKKINEEYDSTTNGIIFRNLTANDWKEVIDFRQVRALEIIAGTLIDAKDFLHGLSLLYKDLLIDVENLKKENKK